MRANAWIVLLAAALLATVSLTAHASNHQAPEDNGTTLPDAQEATQTGPRNDSPVSWTPVAIVPLFLLGLIGLFLLARRWRRQDR